MTKTRFSPSPTGFLHLGNVRSGLFSALYAASLGGDFILRIEDTDQTRSEEKYTEILQDDLQWLGIRWQEGPGVGGPHAPYFQSQRHAIYAKYYDELAQKNLAYPCFCSDEDLALNRKIQLSRGQAPRYPGTCRNLSASEVAARIAAGQKPALRFQVPTNKAITFDDLVKGPQHFNSDDIGDFIIRRADGSSSFLFCNAIDDSLMGVTQVVRGEDHLSNTPRQLMILQALNLRLPGYGHLPLMVGADGAKLSKRHGSSSLRDLRQAGFLAVAVLNYLARLSHAYDNPGLLSFTDLAKDFNAHKISRAPARFDEQQLAHWQKEAVMQMSAAAAWEWLGKEIQADVPVPKQELFIALMRQNILFPQDAALWVKIFFTDLLDFSDEAIAIIRSTGREFFVTAKALAEQEGIDIQKICAGLTEKLKVKGKALYQPLRIALTGLEHGPELVHIVNLLGPTATIARFARAAEMAG